MSVPGARNPSPEPGDAAPDADLLDAWGRAARLSSAWSVGPAVLVFLRYFGCPFCQMQVVGLRRDHERFVESGGSVTLVGQGPPEEAVAFRERRDVPFPVFVDPDRRAYRAYGLERGRPSQVYGPRVAVPFVRANLTGKLQRGLHGGSFLQMPGSFVIDGHGILQFAHRNRTVADNPSNQALLDAVAAISPEDATPATEVATDAGVARAPAGELRDPPAEPEGLGPFRRLRRRGHGAARGSAR